MSNLLSSFVPQELHRCIIFSALCSLPISSLAQTPSHPRPAPTLMPAADIATLRHALDDYDQGSLSSAEPALRDLARRYPESYEANEALGSLYAETGEFTKAVPYLRQSCTVAPRQALAHANLGAAYLKMGNAPDAVNELEKASALDPENGATESNLGHALLLSKQPRAAAKAFSVAAKITPNDPELRYNLALALYQAGAAREAADLLKQIPSADTNDQVQALAADAEEQTGNFQGALLHFQAAAKLNPSDANLYALTTELLRHWTWPEAIEVADYGSSRYPASTRFRMAAGIANYGKSDYKEAVRIFSGLLQADPNNAAVADLLGRSCSLLADGEDQGCAGMYEFAQKHPGNSVTTTYAAVAILHAPKDKQDLDRAESLLRSAISADPQYAEAYFQLGVLEQTRLQWKESAIALEHSIALRPSSPEAHYRLSRAYTHLGRRDDAQAEIALHQTYSEQAKNHLDAKMQEVVRFLLKPS